MAKNCALRHKREKICNVYNVENCPDSSECPYYISLEDQLKKEKKIVESITARMPYLYQDVKSIVTGEVYISKDEHNATRAYLMEV